MKLLQLLAFLIAFQVATFPQAQPVPTPLAPRPVDENWKTIQPESDVFSIESPGEFYREVYSDSNTSQRFIVRTKNAHFYVFSDSIKSPEYFLTVKSYMKSLGAEIALPESEADGRVLNFVDEFGYFQTLRWIRTKNRIYTVQAFSLKESSKDAERFVKSFLVDVNRDFPKKLIGDSPSTNQSINKNQINASNAARTNSGAGSGNKAGTSGGIGVGTVPSPPSGTVDLRILSKPRAAYTDIARFYLITGRVVVRIVFHSSGEVTEVEIVSGLPMGLTNRALEAARNVKFTPAYVDGKPATVRKTFEYSFEIY